MSTVQYGAGRAVPKPSGPGRGPEPHGFAHKLRAMRILLIGATGIIGSAVHTVLASHGHDVLPAHRGSTQYPVDITEPASIDALFTRTGTVDAVCVTAGPAIFRPLTELSYDDVLASLKGKALGQIEVVRRGQRSIAANGSFTLVTGLLTHEPSFTSAAGSAANGAVESFAKAAAQELAPVRVNVVSPTVIAEAGPGAKKMFAGDPGVPAATAALAFVRSVERQETGQVYEVRS